MADKIKKPKVNQQKSPKNHVSAPKAKTVKAKLSGKPENKKIPDPVKAPKDNHVGKSKSRPSFKKMIENASAGATSAGAVAVDGGAKKKKKKAYVARVAEALGYSKNKPCDSKGPSYKKGGKGTDVGKPKGFMKGTELNKVKVEKIKEALNDLSEFSGVTINFNLAEDCGEDHDEDDEDDGRVDEASGTAGTTSGIIQLPRQYHAFNNNREAFAREISQNFKEPSAIFMHLNAAFENAARLREEPVQKALQNLDVLAKRKQTSDGTADKVMSDAKKWCQNLINVSKMTIQKKTDPQH